MASRCPESAALRQYYDKLVIAITAIEQVIFASKLYSKNVVDANVVDEVLLQSTTPIVKGCNIVSAVQRKVEADPSLFHQFTTFLQEEGDNSLKSLGKQLHDTCAETETHFPTPITTPMASSSPLVPHCHSQQLTLHQPSSASGHSLPLSQPQSPSHSSQPPRKRFRSSSNEQSTALCLYADYLRAVYTRTKLPNAAATIWPPNPSKKYINVAVISKGGVGTTRKEADELRRQAVHGNIGHILKKKRSIEIKEILQSKADEELKCVLVEGAPGIGKSTLAGEICRRWGKREMLQEYSAVVLLVLRNETVQRAAVVADLFHHDDESTQKQVSKEILQRNGSNILIILEGLDELPKHLLTTHSIFTGLLSGRILPQATILVTSRPSATYKFWQEYWHVSCHVEIVGFSEDNIKEYIKSVLPAEELPSFDSYLSMHPHIESMMYVPLHCAIATRVYLQCQQSRKPPPKTLTGLYTCLAQNILVRYLKKSENPDDRKEHVIDNLSTDLPYPASDYFGRLCEIAFKGVDKQQLIFHDLPKPFEHLGFMNAVHELFSHCDSVNYSYNFLHLSVQEYLAAYHVSLMSHSEQEQLLQTVSYGDHRFNMTRFLAGITQFKGLNEATVKKVIGIEDSDGKCAEMSYYTLEFLYECQDVSILDSEHCYSVSVESSKYGLMALGYAVIRCSSKWKLTFSGIDSLYDFPNGSYNIESIKFISCSSEFINSFLLQLPHHVLAHIRSLISENEYPLPPLPRSVPELIPRMERLDTLKLNNTLPISLNRLIELLPRRLKTLSVNDSGKIFSDGGKVPARFIPELMYAVPALKNLGVASESGSNYFKIQFPKYSESGTVNIKCELSAPVIFEQFLQQLSQETISQIGSFIYHSSKVGKGDDIGAEEEASKPQQLPSWLPELLPRMESLNTLTLENLLVTALPELLPALSRVPTLMNLGTVTDEGEFKCTIKVDSGCSDKSQPQLQPYNVDLQYNIAESEEVIQVFDQILQQLLRDKILAHIRSFACSGVNIFDYGVHVYSPLLPSLPKLVLRMGRLETLELKETSLTELDLSRIPTLRKLYISNYHAGFFKYSINVDSSNDNPLPQLQPHCVEIWTSDDEQFDHFLQSLLSGNTLAYITSFKYNGKDKHVWYPMLPSLPKLILAMERLNTLELSAWHDTALAELVPALFATPTLKNVAVYSGSGTYKKEIPEPTDNGPINGTIHCSPDYDSEYYHTDRHIDMIVGILQQLPQSVLSHVTSFFFDSDVGRFKCSINVDSSNDKPLPQLQPHCVELESWIPDYKQSYKCVFDHFLQSLLSGNTLAHITSFRYNYNDKDGDNWWEPMLPSLPMLILAMERLNTLELGARHDTAPAELVPALFATPTLKNVTVYSNSGTYKKEIPEPTDNGLINGTIHCSPNCGSGCYYVNKDEHIDMIDGILQQLPQYVLSHVTSFFFDFDVGSFKCSINVDSSNDTPLPQLQPHHVDLEHMGICDSEKSIQLFDCFLQQLLPGIILPDMESFSCYGEIDNDQLPSYLPKLILRMERLNLVKLKSLTLHKLNSQDLTLLFQWQPTYQLETLTLPSLSPDHIEMVSRSLIPVSSLKTLGLQRSEFLFQNIYQLRLSLTLINLLQLRQSQTEEWRQWRQSLTEVSIRSYNDSACCLAETLHHNTTLRKLNMSGNPLGERGALAMAEMLKDNTTLEELDLRYAEISSDGAIAITEALHHNMTLRKLDISENPVGEEGALAMAEMLKHHTILEELDLRNAEISSDGAIAMTEALHHNMTLRKLDISENPVGEEGALAMAEMLKHNTTLEELGLNCSTTEVNDKAIKALIANLAVNHHLKKLIINRDWRWELQSLPEYRNHKERVECGRSTSI